MTNDQLARLREKVEKLTRYDSNRDIWLRCADVLDLIDAEAGEPEKCRYCGLPAAYHDEFQMCTQAAPEMGTVVPNEGRAAIEAEAVRAFVASVGARWLKDRAEEWLRARGLV